MKIKAIILIILCMLFCGCSTTSNQTIEDAIKSLESHNKTSNIYRTGYKYYLPINMKVDEYHLYNEILSNINSNNFSGILHCIMMSAEIDYTTKNQLKKI